MTVCIDCEKKINRYFSDCERYRDGFVCAECNNKRRAEYKIKKDFSNMTQEEFGKINEKDLTESGKRIYEQEENYRQSSEYQDAKKQEREKAEKDLLTKKVNAELDKISKIWKRVLFVILFIFIGGLLWLPFFYTDPNSDRNPYDTYGARFWSYVIQGSGIYVLAKILGYLIALTQRNKIKEKIMKTATVSENTKVKYLSEDFAQTSDCISDGDIKKRILCSDGNCIGFIGADGHCIVCGKRFE